MKSSQSLMHLMQWFYDGFAADRSLALLVSCYGIFVHLTYISDTHTAHIGTKLTGNHTASRGR